MFQPIVHVWNLTKCTSIVIHLKINLLATFECEIDIALIAQ